MNLVLEMVIAFLATVAFAIVFNVPSRCILFCGGTGAVGWFIFQGLGSGNDAIFLASLMVGLIAEFGARKLRVPVSVLSVPGVIPLVPGGIAYSTMLSVVKGNTGAAISQGVETVFSAGAIAVGVALAEIPFRLVKKRRQKDV